MGPLDCPPAVLGRDKRLSLKRIFPGVSMNRLFCFLAACVLAAALPVTAQSAPAPLTEAQLREALASHPDVLLDVLRDHSEELLDIVREGAVLQRNKAAIATWKKDMEVPKQISTRGHAVRGPASAPVTIVAFSDFTCPYCQKAAKEIQTLMANNPGKVKYVFKAMPLDNTGTAKLASAYFAAAALQSPEKAWALYDLFFAERGMLVQAGPADLLTLASQIGLDAARLEKDAASTKIQDLLEADIAEGERLGVDGTPTFFINDIIVRGAVSQDLFAKALSMALEASGAKARR